MDKLNIVILAAGEGKRMNSNLPKVLHKVGNKPMLQHVIETANRLNPSKLVVVYGHGGKQVVEVMDEVFTSANAILVPQEQQLGTGHALRCAMPYVNRSGATLVLYGDVPLISYQTLIDMLDNYCQNVVMLTTQLENPSGYGRVVRDEKFKIRGIVEEKDATYLEKSIKEINTGIYLLPSSRLSDWLDSIKNDNNQGEYYLTDVIARAYNEGIEISNIVARCCYEVMGVNNKLQLEVLERAYQLQQAETLLEMGATLLDKSRIDIRGKVTVGIDCMIDVNCIFEGEVSLGNNVTIGNGCVLKDVKVGDGVVIKPYSIIESAEISSASQIGPYARIRPGTKVESGTHIGNFVEIKNSRIGVGSKVNHLTYIGDAELGTGVNVGAGSVTCNYDGKDKHKTIIEDDVFIGSGTMMVAPVVIREGSIIGAGSTITKDTEANELTVARAKQITVKGWVGYYRKNS